jgi:hypothetical protein
MNSKNLISRAVISVLILAATLSFTEVISPSVDPDDKIRRLGFLAGMATFISMAALVWLVQKYKAKLVRPVVLGMLILYSPIFSANALVTWQDSNLNPELDRIERRAAAAAALGLPFDERKYVDALTDIRAEHPNVLQKTSAKEFIQNTNCQTALDINGVKTVPIAALASTPMLLRNELGSYPIWMTDRYGFNNPDSIWDDTSLLDSIIIGDSFAAGESLEQGDGIAAQLRKLDHESLNLASFGAGPLVALAQLREYGSSIQTDYVFWIYYHGNDFTDLALELNHSVINRYLDPAFSQNLRANWASIDPVYRGYALSVLAAQSEIRNGSRCHPVSDLRFRVGEITSLINFKNTAAKIVANIRNSNVGSGNIAEFSSIATLIDIETRQSGAQLVFVFLPKYFEPSDIGSVPPVPKGSVLEIISDAGIPIIDIQETLNEHRDPASFYALKTFAHMSPFGYQSVAKELKQYTIENRH